MRKKFTLLFAALLAFVGVVKAGPTDLPAMSTEGDIKWYTIRNTRSTSGQYLYWTESGVKDANSTSKASLFYFTGTAKECYIHNAATDLLFTGAGAWNKDGVKCEISVTPYGDGTTGLAIKFSNTALNENNNNNTYTTWGAADAGSVFVIEEAPVAQMAADYKTAAIAALDMIQFLGVDDEKAAINDIEANIDAFAAVDAIVNGVAQYVAFRNGETNTGSVRYNNYLAAYMPSSKGHGASTFNWLNATWSLKYSGEGSFYIYNVNQKVYLGSPSSNGTLTKAPNSAYTFEVIEGNKVEFKSGGQTLHMNNHNGNGAVASGNALTNHDGDDVASRWYVETDFASHAATYKTSAITTLDGLASVSGLFGFDATLVATVKSNIENNATVDFAVFAAIDAELKKATDMAAAKNIVFQNSNTTDANRSNVYLATDMSDSKGRGNKEFDYNAVWNLQSAGGASFYLYNDLNKVYLGTPGSEGALTSAPAAVFTFEVVDANTSLVEIKTGGQTMHVHNWADCTLTNWDGDETASRWYVSIYDIAADIQAHIEANASKHAEIPELGQYTTAAYNALVEAGNSATTVAEVAEAIAAFEATLNRPVYFITSKNEGAYSDGAAIYYDGAWKWGTANIYNKQMWMTIPGYTEENVPAVEAYDAEGTSYAICDYLTGTKMRGKDVQIVKVAGKDGVVNLQYGTATNDAVQHAQDGGALVGWNPASVKGDGTMDCGASAWYVEFIGTSYELAQLTDEFFAAANELAAINVPNFNFAAGVNNYDAATRPALAAAVANRATVLSEFSTADEIAAAKTQLETAIAGVQLNMPENGKFYRVRCAGEGMKRIQSTINNNRLQMIGGDTGINANSIFCYIDGSLLSYTTGQYINAYNLDAVGSTKSTVTFSNAYNGTLGQYNIKINNSRYIYGKKDEIDSGTGNPTDGGYNWWLEEVTSLPVAVSAAGYATFIAPVALQIPEDVKAYTGVVTGDYLILSKVEGTIPANTGVVLEAEEGTYNFNIVDNVEAIASDLVGSTAAVLSTSVTEGKVPFTLQKPSDAVVFMQFDGDVLAGSKAYLELDPTGANAISIRFEGSTDIENVEIRNEKSEMIYDLLGRRVEAMTKGGIYIVNGKKVVIK